MRRAGDVTHVDVLRDEQGRSKGCAVVRYATPPEAYAAIGAMNGSELQVCGCCRLYLAHCGHTCTSILNTHTALDQATSLCRQAYTTT
jgi:RNA recognition motif. (a.k.a. RRM, RBD, or RNP domain)